MDIEVNVVHISAVLFLKFATIKMFDWLKIGQNNHFLTAFFYLMFFIIMFLGRKVEVTLGRSIYFVMISAFLQTIPQVLGQHL